MATVEEQASMLVNRVRKNRRRLKPWCKKNRITCYRLYDHDIPELPLVVDWYDGRLHVAEYDWVHGRSSEEQRIWVQDVVAHLAKELDLGPERVFVKQRRRTRGGQVATFDDQGAIYTVGEGGYTFEVNLSDKLDTGLFLDHRTTREMVRAEARGKRFLNLFCYTASFSVYAAGGGAASTTSVDLSRSNLEWAERNMALNGFSGSAHRTFRSDAFKFLENAGRRRERYDLAVVDPPSYSVSKGADDFDVQRDHAGLIAATLSVLSPGGVLYFSTNLRRFELDDSPLRRTTFAEITDETTPDDFRRCPHRCWRAVVADGRR